MDQADVIIIGGGVTGLATARMLCKAEFSVTVLEARSRLGGRVYTVNDPGFPKPVEAGAEFIHGDLPKTFALLREAGLASHAIEGAIWQNNNGKFNQEQDFVENGELLSKRLQELTAEMTVTEFLDKYFSEDQHSALRKSVKSFVEGYDAADSNRASALALRDEWTAEDQEQYRPDGGYGNMIRFMEEDLQKHGCNIRRSAVAARINWQQQQATITTSEGDVYKARQVVITVPLSLLQEDAIGFYPPVPQIASAARSMGFGSVIKILLQFKNAFWKTPATQSRLGADLSALGWLFSDAAVPTWWTQLPEQSSLLTGWLAGPNATTRKDMDDPMIVHEAITSLAALFTMAPDEVREQLVHSRVFNWLADPFSRGAYSYTTTQSEAAVKMLEIPIAETLFFAGEAMAKSPHTGTVEGALESGEFVAQSVKNAWDRIQKNNL